MVYHNIINSYKQNKKLFALLIDPDNHSVDSPDSFLRMIETAKQVQVDFLLIGGSLVSSDNVTKLIELIKSDSSLPVVLFPGNLLQISENADSILFLSLISGRNPEFLIGNHVNIAPFIKKSNLEVISTGYILIEGGQQTSVEYMSNTKPIPHNKTDIAVATALAGQYLGNKLIYMDAGSGACKPINKLMITGVKNSIDIPLIIGGGLRTPDDIKNACNAGADIIVVGTAIEENSELTRSFSDIIHRFNQSM